MKLKAEARVQGGCRGSEKKIIEEGFVDENSVTGNIKFSFNSVKAGQYPFRSPIKKKKS
jgi:hypothetical protein